MPRYACKAGFCAAYLDHAGYCADHAHLGQRDKRDRNAAYDELRRSPEAERFYNSAAWHRARKIKLTDFPGCERCDRIAQHVHHLMPVEHCLSTGNYDMLYDQSNLLSVCQPCHMTAEAESRAKYGRAGQ